MKVCLELDELEIRILMHAIYQTNTHRVWYTINSWRTSPANEDHLTDLELGFMESVFSKIRIQLKNQGIEIDKRSALIAPEEAPTVKEFLISNDILPTCPEHKGWVKRE